MEKKIKKRNSENWINIDSFRKRDVLTNRFFGGSRNDVIFWQRITKFLDKHVVFICSMVLNNISNNYCSTSILAYYYANLSNSYKCCWLQIRFYSYTHENGDSLLQRKFSVSWHNYKLSNPRTLHKLYILYLPPRMLQFQTRTSVLLFWATKPQQDAEDN
jgi:hypothetical protein